MKTQVHIQLFLATCLNLACWTSIGRVATKGDILYMTEAFSCEGLLKFYFVTAALNVGVLLVVEYEKAKLTYSTVLFIIALVLSVANIFASDGKACEIQLKSYRSIVNLCSAIICFIVIVEVKYDISAYTDERL